MRFDRNEFSGAFGDLGTDFPLIVGLILACQLDATSVLIVFGLAQIASGLIYRLPMPVQPFKAMAVIAISQKLSADVVFAGGLAVGIVMLALTGARLIEWIARNVPKCVIRGIQFGLGIKLANLALHDYIRSDGTMGYCLAALSFIVILSLLGNRRLPPALPVIAVGLAYAFVFRLSASSLVDGVHLGLPALRTVSAANMLTGFLVFGLAQIPLSIGNSVLATDQLARDLFPERPVGVRKLCVTYSLINMIVPFFGGIPVCHGSGGLAGHYAFGARTGASVVIYGSLFLLLGLFFGSGFQHVAAIFPLPMLGMILMFEGFALMKRSHDVVGSKQDYAAVLLVGLLAAGLPYGFLIALVLGTVLVRFYQKRVAAIAENT